MPTNRGAIFWKTIFPQLDKVYVGNARSSINIRLRQISLTSVTAIDVLSAVEMDILVQASSSGAGSTMGSPTW